MVQSAVAPTPSLAAPRKGANIALWAQVKS